MNKRILGSVLFACLFMAVAISSAMVFLSTSTQAAVTIAPAIGAKAKAPDAGTVSTWMDVAPFPTVSIPPTPGSYPLKLKRACAAAYPSNGKVYLFGGRHGTDGEDITLQWIWELTPGDPGSWVRKNALLDGSQPGSRFTANMACAALNNANGDSRIYLVGGSSINSEPTPSVRVYDPNADQVTALTTDPWPVTPVHVPGAYAVYNNKLYIVGGFSALGSGAVFADTWEFDPTRADGQRWRRLTSADLNTPRGYMAGAILDGKLYAIGGDTWNPTTHTLSPVNNVERLDLTQANPTWTNIASLPTARGDMGAWAYNTGTGYEISGHIAIAGGGYPEPDPTGYLYDPGNDSWGSWASLMHATRNYGATEMDGYLYALGGYDYTNHTPTGANFSQVYDATSPGGTPTPTPTECTITFSDVNPGDFFYEAVQYLACHGAISGYDDGTFRPYNNTKRGQLTKIVVLSEGWPIDTTGGPHFTDVSEDYVFYVYIETAYNHGIINGYGDGSFRPENNVTRAQLSKIIVLAQGWEIDTTGGPHFSDVPTTHPFYGYIETAYNHGIINGYNDGTFRPDNNATRAQISVIVYRAITGAPPQPTNTPSANTPTATSVAGTATRTPTRTPTPGLFGVQIMNFAFNPQNITIPVGSFIRWTNFDSATHTATSDTGVWDSGNLGQNQFYQRTFSTPGVFPYHCTIHPSMTGTITVTGSAARDVAIQGFAFVPPSITIPAGTSVRWTNMDAIGHTSTSTSGVWDSGNLNQNQSYTHTFNTPGTYSYICTPHPNMTGTIIVTGSDVGRKQ